MHLHRTSSDPDRNAEVKAIPGPDAKLDTALLEGGPSGIVFEAYIRFFLRRILMVRTSRSRNLTRAPVLTLTLVFLLYTSDSLVLP